MKAELESLEQPELSRSGVPTKFIGRVSLSRNEVAETLGCSSDFVDKLIEDGVLHATKVRGLVFVLARDVWALAGIAAETPGPVSERARSILRGME